MVQYYPEELSMSKLARLYPELEIIDEDEEQRFQDITDRKKRGKGAPKKAKTKGTFIYLLGKIIILTTVIIDDSRRTNKKKK